MVEYLSMHDLVKDEENGQLTLDFVFLSLALSQLVNLSHEYAGICPKSSVLRLSFCATTLSITVIICDTQHIDSC